MSTPDYIRHELARRPVFVTIKTLPQCAILIEQRQLLREAIETVQSTTVRILMRTLPRSSNQNSHHKQNKRGPQPKLAPAAPPLQHSHSGQHREEYLQPTHYLPE